MKEGGFHGLYFYGRALQQREAGKEKTQYGQSDFQTFTSRCHTSALGEQLSVRHHVNCVLRIDLVHEVRFTDVPVSSLLCLPHKPTLARLKHRPAIESLTVP